MGGVTRVTGQARTPTAVDIEEAIRWGETGTPSPYLLHHAQYQGTTDDVVVGAVYTPFVRVALAAHAAHDKGERLDPENIPEWVVEPVVYIAFRWYCCDGDHGDMASYHPLEPFDYALAVPGRPAGLRNIAAPPLWVERDLSLLNAFGGVPYSDVVLLAGYPLPALSQPGDFVIYRNVPNPANPQYPGTLMEIGRVTASDVRDWR